MAPDINSLPDSPRQDHPPTATNTSQPQSIAASRRTSTAMAPPAVPASAMAAHAPHRPLGSPDLSGHEHSGLPMRHPRPLTAAELYLECEKEQEAVVCAK
jgi:hypothetical protein